MDDKMKIVDASASGLMRTFTIDLDADWVDASLSAQLKSMGRATRIKGFRTGKAPLSLLRSRFGARLTQEVVDQLAVTVSRKIIEDGQLRPVSRPQIEGLTNPKEGQFRFKLIIEVLPEIALHPFDGLTIQRLTAVPDGLQSTVSDEVTGRWLSDLSWLHVKRQVLDWLASRYSFDVPGAMVNRELGRILQSHKDHVETHIDHALEQRYREVAQRRVRLAIVLLELGKSNNLRLAQQDIGKLVQSRCGREEGLSSIVKFYVDHPTALAELQSPVLEDAVVALIVSKARVIDRTVTADELAVAASEGILDLEHAR